MKRTLASRSVSRGLAGIEPSRSNTLIAFAAKGGSAAAAVTVQRPTTRPSDPNAAGRRDYELALQIGTIPVWNSFISNYPSGFYMDYRYARLAVKQTYRCRPKERSS
jgi:hypothetical protein